MSSRNCSSPAGVWRASLPELSQARFKTWVPCDGPSAPILQGRVPWPVRRPHPCVLPGGMSLLPSTRARSLPGHSSDPCPPAPHPSSVPTKPSKEPCQPVATFWPVQMCSRAGLFSPQQAPGRGRRCMLSLRKTVKKKPCRMQQPASNQPLLLG